MKKTVPLIAVVAFIFAVSAVVAMKPARHPEAPERKRAPQSESSEMLSKMTKRGQGVGWEATGGISILAARLGPHCPLPKWHPNKAGARAWRPGPEW